MDATINRSVDADVTEMSSAGFASDGAAYTESMSSTLPQDSAAVMRALDATSDSRQCALPSRSILMEAPTTTPTPKELNHVFNSWNARSS